MTASTPDPNRWKALGVCLVAGFMTLLDISIVNVALPAIKTGLHEVMPVLVVLMWRAGPGDVARPTVARRA